MKTKEIKSNTYDIIVPKGIRYLSQWKDFSLFDFPHILDKQIPGCGFTEFCLTNDQDLVLCSPRKLLLENKYDQHKSDIYYVINSYEKVVGVDKDITKDSKSQQQLDSGLDDTDEIKRKKQEYYEWLKDDINRYILDRNSKNLPFKIIVTYDSFYLVKGILKEISVTLSKYINNQIQFVIDEFQSIFTDATFKSSTENDFITSLKDIRRLCYVSATPMIEEYLRLIDIFETIPYYELDWGTEDPGRIRKPELQVRITRSVVSTAGNIIQSYLDGKFESKYVNTGEGVKEVQSKEAVIYLNSVNNIISIVKKFGLKPEQVNLLVADTPENRKKMTKRLGKKFSIGKVPLKGEEHKQFTFCTRTVYLGADFYSTNARSFILSDANIETLMVDISLDLPQILGRQRLEENPWKNSAEFYYKSICKSNKKSREEFDKIVAKKYNDTLVLIKAFDNSEEDAKLLLAGKYEDSITVKNYRRDYVAVNNIVSKPGVKIKKAALNKLVMIAEQRAFDIQQVDYKDRFNVFNAISENDINSDYQKDVLRFFEEYEKLTTLSAKLKFFCEYQCELGVKNVILSQITEKHFHEYIDSLGPEKLRAEGYNISRINKRLRIISFDKDELSRRIKVSFSVGNKYSLFEIKNTLCDIYQDCGYEKSPVASDLGEYFEIKRTKLKDNSGSWIHGFEIINYKL